MPNVPPMNTNDSHSATKPPRGTPSGVRAGVGGARKLKAITIPQPRATLLALGAIQYEVRTWRPEYLGPILIHAGARKRPGQDGFEQQARDFKLCYEEPFRTLLREAGYTYVNDLPFGAFVAAARLKAVYWGEMVRLRLAEDSPERHFSDFGDRLRVWQFWHVLRWVDPLPVSGKPGLWEWDCPAGFRPKLEPVPPTPLIERDSAGLVPPATTPPQTA